MEINELSHDGVDDKIQGLYNVWSDINIKCYQPIPPPPPPPPGQNGHHFPVDIFKCIFVNEKICILIPNGPNDNKSALVQVMAWRQTGDKPLSEPILTQFNDAHMRH